MSIAGPDPLAGRESATTDALLERIQFETLIASIARRFLAVDSSDFDRSVEQSLSELGLLLQVDRCYLFRISDDGESLSNTHEWCAEGIEPQIEALQSLPTSACPWFMAHLYREEPVHIADIELLPSQAEAERKMLEAEDIQSLVCVPMFAGTVIGFLGLDAVRKKMVWSEGDIALLNVVADIFTRSIQRLASEQHLRESEGRFRNILESSPDAIFIEDLEGNVLVVNQAACDLHGMTRRELTGKNVLDLVPPEQREQVRSDFPKVVEGALFDIEGKSYTSDGRTVPVEIRATKFQYDGQPAILLVVRDATAKHEARLAREKEDELTRRIQLSELQLRMETEGRRQAEIAEQDKSRKLTEALDEVRLMQEQARQQERLSALGRMASTIAHNFNNALSPILGFSEFILKQHGEELPGDVLENLRHINQAAQDASKGTRRLSAFYRGRDHDEVFNPVSFNEVIEESIRLTQPRWKDETMAKGIHIEVETDLQYEGSIVGSDTDVRELLTNLIFNAVDALPKGGRIEVRSYTMLGNAVMVVADNGAGMSEEVLERCMEPFFTTKGEAGSGLGLSAVFGAMRRHEGRVHLDSVKGKGTTVSLIFPTGEAAPSIPPTETEALPLPALRILVVDDEPLICKVVSDFLRSAGHSIVTARNGREGLDEFTSDRFDLVITDMGMPELNGEDLAIAVKEQQPKMPVILLTGWGDELLSAGVPQCIDLLINKPFTYNELRDAVTSTYNSAARPLSGSEATTDSA
jgi:PAS domain S-box-containing protein